MQTKKGCLQIIEKPDHISWQEITDLLHLAFSEKSKRGLNYLATRQDAETTKKRVGDGICLTALHNGKLVGTGTLRIREINPTYKKWYNDRTSAYLVQLGVHPDYTGMGIGRKLLEERLRICEEKRVDEVLVDTSIKAKKLISWWKRLGFQPVELLSYPTTNYYSIVLRKEITGRKISQEQTNKRFYKSAIKTFLRLNKEGKNRKIWQAWPIRISKEAFRKFKRKKIFQKRKELERQLVLKASKKHPVKVAFFLIYESMWKYDYLYRYLQNDNRFKPVIFICPFIRYTDDIMASEMNKCYTVLKSRGYDVKRVLNANGEAFDVKKQFKPDLVFFSTPWNHTYPEYQIDNYMDTLTAYVNYSYTTSTLYRANYNKPLHNYCWKYFVESPMHKEIAKKYSLRKGKNVESFGYAGLDAFLDSNYHPSDPWKKQEQIKKRIIWAPHHTVEGNIKERNLLNYATFLKYSDFMLQIAKKLQDKIQIAFKPHPNLRGKLNQIWGENKTNKYFNNWRDLPNGQLEEGEYVDLFLQSDAMIHDSGSFLIEYLFTHKPVLYLINNAESKKQYNELGTMALTKIPLAYTKEDILKFIGETVLEGSDEYKTKRESFFKEYLKPPKNLLASENIYHYLKKKFEI